jgi:ribosomal protein S12 methylthiotransferase accessory factor
MPVVKVVVPGLRHFWPRFAPGRLFEVPARLGRLTKQTQYDQLNPIPLYLLPSYYLATPQNDQSKEL